MNTKRPIQTPHRKRAARDVDHVRQSDRTLGPLQRRDKHDPARKQHTRGTRPRRFRDLSFQAEKLLALVPRRHREDARQEAVLAQLMGKNVCSAIRVFLRRELRHEQREKTLQEIERQVRSGELYLGRHDVQSLRRAFPQSEEFLEEV